METLEAIAAIIAALGLKIKVVFASAMGAFISLRFFDGLSIWERWVTFFGGVSIGSFVSVPMAQAMQIQTEVVEQGLSLGLGLFGMSIVAAVIKVIRDTDWIGIINNRLRGNDK